MVNGLSLIFFVWTFARFLYCMAVFTPNNVIPPNSVDTSEQNQSVTVTCSLPTSINTALWGERKGWGRLGYGSYTNKGKQECWSDAANPYWAHAHTQSHTHTHPRILTQTNSSTYWKKTHDITVTLPTIDVFLFMHTAAACHQDINTHFHVPHPHTRPHTPSHTHTHTHTHTHAPTYIPAQRCKTQSPGLF